MGDYMQPFSVVAGPFAVTAPTTGGFKIWCFKAERAGTVVTARTSVRTAIGAGTIKAELLNYGTAGTATPGTVFSHGTATAWSASVAAAETIVTAALASGDQLALLIKGDGTLDIVDFACQFDMVYGNPAAAG